MSKSANGVVCRYQLFQTTQVRQPSNTLDRITAIWKNGIELTEYSLYCSF